MGKCAGRKVEIKEVEKGHHTAAMRSLHSQNSSFGAVSRIAKMWINSQLLSNHICPESVELLAASLFLPNSTPYPVPDSHFIGFLRFLQLLSSFDWKNNPLIIDLSSDLSPADLHSISRSFNSLRDSNVCAFFHFPSSPLFPPSPHFLSLSLSPFPPSFCPFPFLLPSFPSVLSLFLANRFSTPEYFEI